MTSLNSLPTFAGAPWPHGEMGYPHREVGGRSFPRPEGQTQVTETGEVASSLHYGSYFVQRTENEFLIGFPPKTQTNYFLTLDFFFSPLLRVVSVTKK